MRPCTERLAGDPRARGAGVLRARQHVESRDRAGRPPHARRGRLCGAGHPTRWHRDSRRYATLLEDNQADSGERHTFRAWCLIWPPPLGNSRSVAAGTALAQVEGTRELMVSRSALCPLAEVDDHVLEASEVCIVAGTLG